MLRGSLQDRFLDLLLFQELAFFAVACVHSATGFQNLRLCYLSFVNRVNPAVETELIISDIISPVIAFIIFIVCRILPRF